MENRQYRGRCRYKSGRCPNERTLKYNGEQVHSLCEEHRLRHNRNQRKADTKRRKVARVNVCATKSTTHQPIPTQQVMQWDFKDDTCSAGNTTFEHNWMTIEDWELEVNDDFEPWTNEDLDLLIECVKPNKYDFPMN